MRSTHLTHYILFGLLVTPGSTLNASAQSPLTDSLGLHSANKLVVELARLIRKNASFRGATLSFRYDAYADTVAGLKLYISEEFNILHMPNDKRWYYIDFRQPIKTNDLTIVRRKKSCFTIDATRRITRKIKRHEKNGQQRERNARLFVPFLNNRKKRTVGFEQLQTRLADIISQLIHD